MSSRLVATFWVLSAALLFTRLLFIGTTMVLDDEAYYLMYARHLDWGYIDHGPVVGYLIRLSTMAFGENGFGIRFPAVLMITILNVVLYRFGKKHFSTATGVALGLTVTAGMLTHMNGVIMTPDAPLAFFTILAILVYYRAFVEDRKYFVPAGILLGLGIFSKISAVFPALAIFLLPFLARDYRRFMREPRFYLSFVVAFLVMLPFVVWNFQNDFAFVRYQGSHVTSGGTFTSFLELWAGVLLLAGPVFFVYGIVGPVRFVLRRRRGGAEPWRLYFSVVTVVPLVYFIAHSLYSRLELNWVAPALFGGVFLFGIAVGEAWPRARRWFTLQIAYSLVLIGAVTVHTWGSILPLRNKNDITDRYYDYNAFQQDLATFLRDHPEVADRRIVANNYQFPSMVNLYQPRAKEAICLSVGYHDTLYGFLYKDDTLVGEDFLVIADGTAFPPRLRSHFESYANIGQLKSQRHGYTVRTFTLWTADGYTGRENPRDR